MKLNKSYFSNNKSKVDYNFRNLQNFLDLLTSCSQVVIVIFFTPMLAVTALFTKELFLVLLNIFLALGKFGALVYSMNTNDSDPSDLILKIALTAVVSVIIFSLTGFFIPSGVLFFKLLYIINVIAISSNLTFSTKDIFVSPLRVLINNLVKVFSKNTAKAIDDFKQQLFQSKIDFCDKEASIRTLLIRNYGYNERDLVNLKARINACKSCVLPDKSKAPALILPERLTSAEEQFVERVYKDVERINKLLHELDKKVLKINNRLFGSLILKEKLTNYQKARDEIWDNDDASRALKIVGSKIIRKQVKLEKFQVKKDKILKCKSEQELKRCLDKYFVKEPFYFIYGNSASVQKAKTRACGILDKEIKIKQQEMDDLRSLLPGGLK